MLEIVRLSFIYIWIYHWWNSEWQLLLRFDPTQILIGCLSLNRICATLMSFALVFCSEKQKLHCVLLHMDTQVLFWPGNQGNQQNFAPPPLLPKKLWLILKKVENFIFCVFRLFFSLCQTTHKGLKIAEKVHKPPLAVNVINFELNGFNASIWVPWSSSESKKIKFNDRSIQIPKISVITT